jgi:hypothetical protein
MNLISFSSMLLILCCNSCQNKPIHNNLNNSVDSIKKVQLEDSVHLSNINDFNLKNLKRENSVNLKILNNTSETLYFGREFELEIYKDNNWIKVENNIFINDIGYKLLPKKSLTMELLFSQQSIQKIGKYKITKKFKSNNKVYESSIEFNVKNDR